MSERRAHRAREPRFNVAKLGKVEQRSEENFVRELLGFVPAYLTCQREFHERRQVLVVERFRIECRRLQAAPTLPCAHTWE